MREINFYEIEKYENILEDLKKEEELVLRVKYNISNRESDEPIILLCNRNIKFNELLKILRKIKQQHQCKNTIITLKYKDTIKKGES